jgi:OmpA-OmpF porin, OOP family
MIVSVAVYAQEILSTKSKKAKEYYLASDNFRVRGQLDQAIDLLKKAIDKDEKFEEAYFRLALTYRSANNLKLASEMLEKGLTLTIFPAKVKTYRFTLSECYLRQGKYELALKSANQFMNDEKFDRAKLSQVKVWKGQCEFALANVGQSLAYQIKYFPTITADGNELIFTIRFGSEHNDNEDIVVSKKENDGKWGNPVSLSDQINSSFREGASTISADGRKLIFTICGPRGCDLYESNKVGDFWSKPRSLGSGVNTSGWEAQPSLSADGNELYFVSDRKGGAGGYDIWYSKKTENNTWAKAINLGKPINTQFDEIAPFIHVNNQNLYFASNGLPGFGSYDIFVSTKSSDSFLSPSLESPFPAERAGVGFWSTPTNMGAPLNDFTDQYSFTVTSDGLHAFYSKEEGKNTSKIYVATIPKQFHVTKRGNIVRGKVIDAISKKALAATIELKDLSQDLISTTVKSDSLTGEYLIILPGKSEYALHSFNRGYLFTSLNFDYSENDLDKPLDLTIEMQPIVKSASVTLNNIFFETNQYDIMGKSTSELDELVLFLTSNPRLSIEIGGHTDNVGSETYNSQLSLKRANSIGTYLKQKGILPNRVKEVGYGSQKPLKANDSEFSRRQNRRIEVKIIQ